MESEDARRKSRIWTHPARLPSRKRFEGHGIARTTPLTSLDHRAIGPTQEGERAPEPTGAERDGDIPRHVRKRDEPHGRPQVATHLHTGAGANPHGGATPRRGNEIPAGNHRTQLHRCPDGCPIEQTQVSAWVSLDGLAKDRSDAQATAARFGAFRPTPSGSGRFRDTIAREQSRVFVACGGAREAISRGAYRCYRYTAGIPQHLQGEPRSNRWIRPPVVVGKPTMGKEVRATGRRARGTLEGPAARAAKVEEGAGKRPSTRSSGATRTSSPMQIGEDQPLDSHDSSEASSSE